jgi:hypothetical protein
MTAACPASRSRSIERIRVGVFIEVNRWPKKRCLALSKAERAADFACLFSVPDPPSPPPVMLAACIAASRLLWMIGEGAGIGVVDADLLGRQLMLDQLVFHAVEGQRAGGVEAERAQVAGQHLHRRDAAGLDRLDELGARGEGEVLAAPEPEPLRIGEIVDGGRAGGGDVNDAGVRKRMLEAQAGAALLRGGDIAALALAAAAFCIGGLVEHRPLHRSRSPAIRRSADPRNPLSAVVGAQRGVGGKNRTPSFSGSACPAGSATSGVTSRRSMPSADQSRWASSISLSDFEIQTALRRPCSQLSRMMRRPRGPCRRQCRRRS